jgi:hypothetical protein
MTIHSTNPEWARVLLLFADARSANEAAKQSEDRETKEPAYAQKAESLSRLIVDYSQYVCIDFDQAKGDCISVYLNDNDPRSGLHIPLPDLSKEARKVIADSLPD